MNEQELLEAAAKAAGIEGQYWPSEIDIHRGIAQVGGSRYWNPLNDDADALRLAVALLLDVYQGVDVVYAVQQDQEMDDWLQVNVGADRMAATRRAIVRAAAEIGQGVVTPNALAQGPGGSSPGPAGATGSAAGDSERRPASADF